MSRFSGKQYKNASRDLYKHNEAAERQRAFDDLVKEAAEKEGLSEGAARTLVNQEASASRGYVYKTA